MGYEQCSPIAKRLIKRTLLTHVDRVFLCLKFEDIILTVLTYSVYDTSFDLGALALACSVFVLILVLAYDIKN